MKKNKKQRRRMTELDIKMVIEEIEAWGNKERGKKLTWSILERTFPFTRQTMYSKPKIQEAYEMAQKSLKVGKNGRNQPCLGGYDDLVVQRLKNRIKELEIQIEEWQKHLILKKL